jgi:hypothetical protein
VGQLNRLQETVQVRVERCRPDIYPAMSLAIDAPHFEYSAGTLFWVEQVQHSWDARGSFTDLGLLAASATGGVNPNQPPIAADRAHHPPGDPGGRLAALGVTATGGPATTRTARPPTSTPSTASRPICGPATPVGPSTPAGLPTAVYQYTSDPTGAQICLTVTDTSLKTGTPA